VLIDDLDRRIAQVMARFDARSDHQERHPDAFGPLRQEFRLLPERAGDLVLANRAGYGWTEDMSEDLAVFSVPLITGYKQALLPERSKGVWMPFLVVGPGIKPGHYLGDAPIQIVDQHPTLLRALGVNPPPWVQGRVLTEIFQ
jgi:hypothetical protein